MRDLFTQALKPIGEVEDGDYDWMQINNGKGWESVVRSPHGASHINAHADQSKNNQRAPIAVTSARLNAAHPPTPVQFKKRDWQAGAGVPTQPINTSSKRANQDLAFDNSQRLKAPTQDYQIAANPNPNETTLDQPRNSPPSTQKKSAWQKISATFCCG